ncbi:ArdC-like ssDNA-binding domain-containing protein [Achromobacter aloeverae]
MDWIQLLRDAVELPGRLSDAYRTFHSYSLGNKLLAALQLAQMQLPLSPIATYKRWTQLGRHLKRGARGIALCMPVTKTIKSEPPRSSAESDTEEITKTIRIFLLRRNWFSLDQTEGAAFAPQRSTPEWNADRALAAMGIAEVPFEYLDGNCQGYAVCGAMEIAINPLAPLPMKTRFHEIAHHLLGHTSQGGGAAVMTDGRDLPRCIREAEAEATAYLCCATLNLPGIAEARGYIQSWLAGASFPSKSARRVFAAADKILRSGQPESQPSDLL